VVAAEGVMALLDVDRINKHFRGLHALRDVSFSVDEGGVFGIIGANGAGKTTLFNIICGALQADSGEVRFADAHIGGRSPSYLCAGGIARTFQVAKPFPNLTVLETIRVAALGRLRRMADATRRAEGIAERFGLAGKAERLGRNLTVLERKRLELARAYATSPRLLLLDEVAAGLRPAEVQDLIGIVRAITEEKITVLMIEHVLPAVFSLARRVAVLDQGQLIAEGPPADVARNPNVISAYLGSGYVPA
jgi:branched-chain amino acid transport system ATP-binding protein